MAATLSTALDVHFSIPQSDSRKPPFLYNCTRRRRFTTILAKTSPEISRNESDFKSKSPSLSQQLKKLTTTLPPSTNQQSLSLSKPKSTWVNPSKPKRSVISLQRQKRSPYSYNPKIRELRQFAMKLNDCDSSETVCSALLEEIPCSPTREDSLLILNSLKSWEKAYFFFNWIKTNKLFPMETIFYNVVMKSLRFGRQFQLIEQLANEMVSNEIELDNITYSTIITCAKRCNQFDIAVNWFERMYKTGLMPDEVTYSAILDVYAKLGNVEEVLSLYERGIASGWKPDPIAFSVLAKMFGESGDYDGIRYVLQEMKSLDVKPNLVVYNSLLEAMGRAGKPGLARSLFEEMVESGVVPNEKTLTALIKIYGKAAWARDALELWEKMKSNGWPMDFKLYNTLLSMCADIGLVEEADKLFEDMKVSEHCKPDSWSYAAMLNIHGSAGNVEHALKLFDEMSNSGIDLNVMGSTCLIQCLGKAMRIDDVVRVFNIAVRKGVKPDDRLCGCLLSITALCEKNDDMEKVVACLEKANPKLVNFVKLIQEEKSTFDIIKEEFRRIISDTTAEARRPFCNCLIDICRNRNSYEKAHELLYLGTLYGLYPSLHNKTNEEWSLDVRSLSIGAAHTALEEWMSTLAKFVGRNEELPVLFSAHTGVGTHKFSKGLANAFASHAEKLALPFKLSEDKGGCFVATRDDVISWVQLRMPLSAAS